MSVEFGKNIKVRVFGESHAPEIGVEVEGFPKGEAIDIEKLQAFMDRRKPGNAISSTKRREPDVPEITSGFKEGVTDGKLFRAVIKNVDRKSSDYENIKDVPRPGHADYTARVKYGPDYDPTGGGPFSGRMTAPLCAAGAAALQILERRGVKITARVVSIGGAAEPEDMEEQIRMAAAEGDSVGGVIECAAEGVPAGLGGPMTDGIESAIAAAVFGIPAVKGIEFGAGFSAAAMRGSQNNDPFYVDSEDGKIKTVTNNCGGILGGISDGMPIIFRVAVKPTPSISMEQDSVSLSKLENVKLSIKGRHDSCIVPRAVPVVEAVTALSILDIMEGEK